MPRRVGGRGWAWLGAVGRGGRGVVGGAGTVLTVLILDRAHRVRACGAVGLHRDRNAVKYEWDVHGGHWAVGGKVLV